MLCDHSVKHDFNIGGEIKKIGSLNEEDLVFLIEQSHPGLNASTDEIASWICMNEDIRILNLLIQESLKTK